MDVHTDIQWYPGHMARAKKLIKKNLDLVDITVEVVDARIPDTSRNPDFEKIFIRKPRVIALNKRDLAEKEAVRNWIKFFRSQGLDAAAVNAAARQGMKELVQAISSAAEPVLQALEAKGRRRRPVRVMIVGIPNVGKSALINALGDKSSAKTGNKPGVTKGPQWIRTQGGLDLLDTPGLLWPKFEDPEAGWKLAATGAISDMVYSVEDVARKLVLFFTNCQPDVLRERYGVVPGKDPGEYLEMIGRKRGFLAPGGVVKIEQTALMLLQEFRNGKLGKFCLDIPPCDKIRV